MPWKIGANEEGLRDESTQHDMFPRLAALPDQQNTVLSTDLSRKGSRNKTLLQLCQATFKKKFFLNHSDNTLGNARLQESRKHRAEVSASYLLVFTVSCTDQAQRYS